MPLHPYVVLLFRLALGGTWIAAAIAKLASRLPRGEAVAAFEILPERASAVVGFFLPYVELALGLSILLGLGGAAAAWASLLLLLLFTAAVVVNLLRGRRIECNCFGQIGRATLGWSTVARNLLLAAVAGCLALGGASYLTVEGWIRGTAFRPGDPPLIGFVAVLLPALGAVFAALILSEIARIARAIAYADDGPSLGSPERRLLRAWMELD